METCKKYSHTYICPPYCEYGVYGGAGLVGKANIQAIIEDDDIKDHVLHLSYREFERVDKWNDEFTPDWLVDDFLHCEPPRAVVLQGGYGSHTLWLLECEETEDIIAALANYPLLDECLHSEMELEAEGEAWENWVRSDLYDTLDDDLQDKADTLDDDTLFGCYRGAMEDENEYPVDEYGSMYINTDRIKEAYAAHIKEA